MLMKLLVFHTELYPKLSSQSAKPVDHYSIGNVGADRLEAASKESVDVRRNF